MQHPSPPVLDDLQERPVESLARRGPPCPDRAELLRALRSIVGRRHVMIRPERTRRYRTGYRYGAGAVAAVVRPGTLTEQWRVLQACVRYDAVVIMQASNTGLTGGSTPDGDGYDRAVVLLNTTRMDALHVIDGGRQVVCFPGTTLNQLEKALKPLGREPHSVIGSSCIGASVVGGVCNNSGGALVQRGPAFTQLALYAQVDGDGRLQLINHLGIELGDEPEQMLGRLDAWDLGEGDVRHDPDAWASDRGYAEHVRDVDAATPARFNADPRRLFEASGCAGKLGVFAVRLDTFPAATKHRVFYIGTNDAKDLTEIRKHVLRRFENLPVCGEYIHRTAFDVANVYGRDTFLLIRTLGTRCLPSFFALKSALDAFLIGRASHLTDRALQWASRFLPRHLPARMLVYRDAFEHHLLLKMSDGGIEEASRFLTGFFEGREGSFFACTEKEGDAAFLHRFAVAGAAVRYRAVHRQEVEDIVALDVALRRNDDDWVETMPPAVSDAVIHALYYGHFFCNVFHRDYVIKESMDCAAVAHEIHASLDERDAAYPAEHNVGHAYQAPMSTRGFYRSLDPCNCFNPGVGQVTKYRDWRCEAVT